MTRRAEGAEGAGDPCLRRLTWEEKRAPGPAEAGALGPGSGRISRFHSVTEMTFLFHTLLCVRAILQNKRKGYFFERFLPPCHFFLQDPSTVGFTSSKGSLRTIEHACRCLVFSPTLHLLRDTCATCVRLSLPHSVRGAVGDAGRLCTCSKCIDPSVSTECSLGVSTSVPRNYLTSPVTDTRGRASQGFTVTGSATVNTLYVRHSVC